MRWRIEFRGRVPTSKTWVYGNLLLGDYPAGVVIALGSTLFNVDPSTVGQSTEVPDITGKTIYEGDIIQAKYDIILIKRVKTALIPFRSNGGKFNRITNWKNAMSGKIIGNVHDNPEMHKGGIQ